MDHKILIFGNGQVGNLYLDYFNSIGWKAEIAKVDVTDKQQVEKAVADFAPTVAINTAAKTNLEYCQNNRLEAFNVNVLGADNIAQVCDSEGIHFLHFSSGCIFQSIDADDVKFEDSEFDPKSYYSLTKVWSEQLVPWNKSENFKCAILRPRQPISANVNRMNMLVKMLFFSKFIDTPNTGTVLEDMMEWTKVIIEKEATGIFHLANPGWTTPYKIGELLKKYINPDMEFSKITKAELDKLTPNIRVDAVLNVDKLKTLGIDPVPYEQRLEETIIKLGENIKNMDKKELKEILDNTLEMTKQRTVVNEQWQKLLEDSQELS